VVEQVILEVHKLEEQQAHQAKVMLVALIGLHIHHLGQVVVEVLDQLVVLVQFLLLVVVVLAFLLQ
jgi:hypothetical protein